VETALESLRANVFKMQDARKGYMLMADDISLDNYTIAAQQIPADIKRLRQLTIDNGNAQKRLDQLGPLVQQKISLMQESVTLRKNGALDVEKQRMFTDRNEQLTEQMIAIMSEMRQEERDLLKQRIVISTENYQRVRIVLGIAVAAIVLILLLNFGRLLVELRNRMRAEAAVRRLSGHILRL
jgi:CHASE3 domain sensor protein